MDRFKGKVARGGTDHKGRPRKYVEIPEAYSDDFDPGDLVRIEKVKKAEQES